MANTDFELEKQLKDAGKQLSNPPDSVDELLPVLDKVEKLLLKVDQSPRRSMLNALKPSMNALINDNLSKHSDIDVKVAVASCISEITRITAPDAPYTDDQMRDIFQLIVSSFEDLADQSSRSYNKRASILETVSKVRSCVIMLDLECDELIVKMFEHFLKSVRDYHLESIFSSMESIMVLVIEESEEISVELLKPLLACVKQDRTGVLPVAHKLAKGVLIKSADKLKPYMMPALTTLGESLDIYHKVVAAVCEGTTANINDNDDNDSGQVSNECKLEKGSVNEAHQADESKHTTSSSDHADKEVKEEVCTEEVVDPTVENKSSVMSNGVNVTVKEEALVDQESKKPEEDKSQKPISKEDAGDSDADMLVKQKSETEKASVKSEKESDTVVNSTKPSGSDHVEDGDKEIEKDNDVKESENENEKDNDVKESENEIEKDNDVKESATETVIISETEKDKDSVQDGSQKVTESKPSETANVSSPSQKKPDPQEDETGSPSKSGSPRDEKPVEKVDPPENKGLTQEDTPEEAEKQAGKKLVNSKEIKLSDNVKISEDVEAGSDSDAKPLKKSTKSTKQSGKKSKQSGKKADVEESDAKKPKQSGKKVDVKGEESDSDAKPLKKSVKKGDKSKIVVEEPQEDDSDNKPLKKSAKKTTNKKDDGKKQGAGKNVADKDQAKSSSGDDDEMDISPKSAKGEGNSTETPVTKSKRSAGKDKDTIKYDESLIGKKVKVWWPEDKMFYEGVVTEYFPAKKKHKVSYVDGDEEKLNLKTQRWNILEEFSVKNNEEQNTEAEDEDEDASPEIHKKKKSKTDPAASQEKIKDSSKKAAGGVSSSSKSKVSTPKTAATTSKETEETPKTGTKTKLVNKSKGKTPPGGSKSNTKAKSDTKDVKSTENTKGGSKSGNKRKKRT